MNNNNADHISDDEISHLAREIHLPLRDGFKERVFEHIRECEKEREQRRDREKTRDRDRKRGIER